MTLEEYLHARYTVETIKAYKREIEIYQNNFKQAEKADYKAIVQYIGSLRNRYHNPRTINRILASIKAYYDFLSSSGKTILPKLSDCEISRTETSSYRICLAKKKRKVY